MSDNRIPDHQWQEFCEGFTRQHRGWLVSMYQRSTRELEQVMSPGQAPVPLFSGNLPLEEVRAGHSNDSVEVMVTVGEGTNETSFLIEDAVALYSRGAGEVHQGLRVDSGDGTSTLIEFRTAAQPESLDGLAESER